METPLAENQGVIMSFNFFDLNASLLRAARVPYRQAPLFAWL